MLNEGQVMNVGKSRMRAMIICSVLFWVSIVSLNGLFILIFFIVFLLSSRSFFFIEFSIYGMYRNTLFP